MGIYIIHILLLVVVRGMFPELKTMTFHPIIVLLIALTYTVVSAFISELIRKSPLAFLMKI
jgi:surface polysaccharide O-acyltransferase-like enzyme